MPEGASTRLVLPIGAAVALAASAAVWVVPLGFLHPRSITGAETGAPEFKPFERPATAVKAPDQPEVKKDWMALAKFDEFRDKPEVVAEDPNSATPPVPVAKVELHWQYLGFAGTPERPAAFMEMGHGSQRVVYLNEQIPDANDPNGAVYTIKSIDPQKVVVEHQGATQTFELTTREMSLKPPTPEPKQRPTIVGGMRGSSPLSPGSSSPAVVNPTSPNTPGVRAR